ncbi:MAG: glycosyltransferase family 4 protein [Eubacterium sp.]|nr:glycosyltransferase family 4 protein [Eubacterium sp.]
MIRKNKRVLMLASVASMIDQFNMPNIRLLQDMGYEVHTACNFKEGNTCDAARIERLQNTLRAMGVTAHQWDCPRGIRSIRKCARAYVQLKKLLKQYSFAWMHCHSPVGGALARIGAHRQGIPVIYTAHGFHFYKGAPVWNWLFYYPVEKLLAHWTDVLITVNKEDYRLAKRRMRAGMVCYTPGIGIDVKAGVLPECIRSKHGLRQFRREFLEKYHIPQDGLLLLSVGELSRRKNHMAVIDALARLSRKDIYYVICGQGAWDHKLMAFASKLGVLPYIRLTGYLEDMERMYRCADIFVFPSRQEGMPVALMEAMSFGLACIVSDIRGNRELIDLRGGAVFPLGNGGRLATCIMELKDDIGRRQACGMFNRWKIKQYGMDVVGKRMRGIYASMPGICMEKANCRRKNG